MPLACLTVMLPLHGRAAKHPRNTPTTPAGDTNAAPPRIAVCISRLWPFQRSANVKAVSPLREKDPTAVQAVVDVHDTATSRPAVAPVGLAVVWIDQPTPSHRSASGNVALG